MLKRSRPPGQTAPSQESLGYRFWTLLVSSASSNLADGVVKVVLPLIAVRWTDSPVLVSGILVSLSLPWLLFAIPAGVLVDSVDRRLAMMLANLVRVGALLALAVAISTRVESIWVLYLVAFVLGIVETVYDTAAQSLLPSVVPVKALGRANGRLSAAEISTNLFVGPPLGGFLVATGIVLGVTGSAGLWGVALVALVLLPGRFRPDRSEFEESRPDLLGGIRFVWDNHVLRAMALMVSVCNIATSAFLGTFVVFAVGSGSAMALSDTGYGALLTSAGAGSLVGSMTTTGLAGMIGRGRLLATTLASMGLFVGLPAVTSNYWWILISFFVGGFAVASWNVVTLTFRQRVTPDTVLGRVNSFYRLIAWGTLPLGALLGGALAEVLGMQVMFAVLAALALLPLLGVRIVNEHSMSRAETAADVARDETLGDDSSQTQSEAP